MKFYPNNLQVVISKITNGQIKSLLLYGSNYGYITAIVKQIQVKLNLLVTSINFKDLSPGLLDLSASGRNFFGQGYLLKITDTGTKLDNDIQNLLLTGDFPNFICFISNSSLPATGIRKFFESEPTLGAMGCYYDDEQTTVKIILSECNKYNRTIDEEALRYLQSHLKGDYQLIRNELNKLFNYTHDQPHINKEHIAVVLSSDTSYSGDEMCIYFAKADAYNFLQELEKLERQNINEITIIRILIKYYINLYIVAKKIENGEQHDRAIDALTSPVFFKYVKDFKEISKKIMVKDIVRILNLFQQAELEIKKDTGYFDFINKLYIPAHNTI